MLTEECIIHGKSRACVCDTSSLECTLNILHIMRRSEYEALCRYMHAHVQQSVDLGCPTKEKEKERERGLKKRVKDLPHFYKDIYNF